MKRIVQAVLAAAAVLLAGNAAQAQTYPLTFRLTLQEQLPSKFNETTGTYTDKVKSTQLSANYLLKLLEPFYAGSLPGGKFPLGSRLQLVDYDHFQVKSPSGTVLVESTAPYLTYSDTYSQTNFLFKGRENINTEALNHTYFYHSTIQFHDPAPEGVSFVMTFKTTERYVRLKENRQGLNPAQGTLTLSGFGSGWIGNSYILLSGSARSPVAGWYE